MPSPGRALLYARTLRHLTPAQWLYLPLRRLQARLPAPTRGRAEPLDGWRTAPLAAALAALGPGDAARRIASARAVLRGEFRFLNHAETLPSVDWGRRHVGHLWSYNLHYFEYARDLAWAHRLTGDARFVRRFEELALGWVEGTRGRRGDGWEPYALSVRALSWSAALLLLGDALAPGARAVLAESLHGQLRALERRLERHIQANHLQKNLQALAVGGLLFRGPAAERWAARGAAALWRETLEQVLPDGCHYERSPMYHALALADLLETHALVRAAGREAPPRVTERLRAMARAYGLLLRADGTLRPFNDAAEGIAPPRAEVAALAAAVLGEEVPEPRGAFALADGGYFGWADAAGGERILVDCGPPGPEHQPGHAHCDVLSFELDLAGRPVVVDAGVSGYDGDPLREYVRSTRAHNTVSIAGREQSEVWGTFRVGRRAAAQPLDAGEEDGEWRFRGACVPFHDRGARHEREVRGGGGRWTVTDRVRGAQGAPLASWLHLHPDFDLRPDGEGFVAAAGGTRVRLEPFGADAAVVLRGESDPAQGWHCPEFGRALPAPVLELRVQANDGRPFGCVLTLL